MFPLIQIKHLYVHLYQIKQVDLTQDLYYSLFHTLAISRHMLHTVTLNNFFKKINLQDLGSIVYGPALIKKAFALDRLS